MCCAELPTIRCYRSVLAMALTKNSALTRITTIRAEMRLYRLNCSGRQIDSRRSSLRILTAATIQCVSICLCLFVCTRTGHSNVAHHCLKKQQRNTTQRFRVDELRVRFFGHAFIRTLTVFCGLTERAMAGL